MTDYQVCQRCGKVYASREIDGPESMTWMMKTYDHAKMCPKCGGDVIWQSSPVIVHGFDWHGADDVVGTIVRIILLIIMLIAIIAGIASWIH
jgi:hypothetical protein